MDILLCYANFNTILKNSPWQRCQTNFSRNILAKTPSKYQKGLAAELSEMYNCRTIEQARKKKDEIINDYRTSNHIE